MITTSDIIDRAVQVVVTSSAALGGVWLGSRLAADRVRRERAAERSLRWHENCAKRMYELANLVRYILALYDNGAEVPPEIWIEYRVAVVRMNTITAYSRLYATNKTEREIRKLRAKLRGDASQLLAEPGDDGNKEMLRRMVTPVLPALMAAATALSNEVRSQLSLDSLEPTGTRERLGKLHPPD